MKWYSPSKSKTAKVAILIKTSSFKEKQLDYFYIDPLVKAGVPIEDIVCFDLGYIKGKAKAVDAKAYLQSLFPILTKFGVTKILICDSASTA